MAAKSKLVSILSKTVIATKDINSLSFFLKVFTTYICESPLDNL